MYNMRLSEDKYPAVAAVHRLNKFRLDQRVIYSGRTNYSYGDSSNVQRAVSKAKGTIVGKSELNIVIMLDDYKKPYQTKKGIDVIPPKQYALVTEADLACGTKEVDIL